MEKWGQTSLTIANATPNELCSWTSPFSARVCKTRKILLFRFCAKYFSPSNYFFMKNNERSNNSPQKSCVTRGPQITAWKCYDNETNHLVKMVPKFWRRIFFAEPFFVCFLNKRRCKPVGDRICQSKHAIVMIFSELFCLFGIFL